MEFGTSKADQAASTFLAGFNCCESVVSSFADDVGLDRTVALKIACGFGGGMGRMAGVCGAVTGAFIVIGRKHGRTDAKDVASKEKTYELVREFTRRFRADRGSIICRDLLGYDISTKEGHQKATDESLFTKICPECVRASGRILQEIL